jgi:hypothetical protein
VGQESSNCPEWNEDIVPSTPCTKRLASAAVARFKSGRQSAENPWGLTPPTKHEEEEGTWNVAESTDILKNGDTGPKKTVKMLRQKPNDRVQALATRLSVSEVVRRNAEDKFHEQYAHAVGLGKQILAVRESQKVVDHFPYAFWPSLPWTQAPPDLADATPPHIWDARNKAPEHVKHEGKLHSPSGKMLSGSDVGQTYKHGCKLLPILITPIPRSKRGTVHVSSGVAHMDVRACGSAPMRRAG